MQTDVGDMHEMPFADSSFDVVWSEGAIYNLGFESGLKAFKRLVKPEGYVAVSEVIWLKPNPPTEVVEFWQDYPEIDTVDAKLAVIESVGYKAISNFVFPTSAWTNPYYAPLEKRIAEYESAWRGNAEAEAVIREARDEVSIFRRFSDYFGYAFFTMRS